jgi:3-oxoadipate enol-lactonase
MNLSFDDLGQGRPLVLLHAFPLSREMFSPQHTLSDSCRLLLPDLPGFGGSPGSPKSVEAMADAVAAFLDARAVGPVVLGGVSMGGYVSLAFARKYGDRLAGLVLADTKAEPDDETAKAGRQKMIDLVHANGTKAVVEQMLPKLLATPGPKEEVKRIASSQKPATVAAALAALRDRPDARPSLGEIKVPTLVIVGREDGLTPPAVAQALAEGIKGATLCEIDAAGHLANMERAGAFNDAVRAFLASLPT